MLGPPKARHVDRPVLASLETLVPPDNFYRHLEAKLDLSFVRALVRDRYAATGRPSIDPVVFFRLQLIMFFEGIRSERKLVETASLHLAHRWYLGYALDEPLPDHSSLSRIRARLGLPVFRRFFERIVELCQDAGLVWGRELFFDATKVRANADIDSLVPRLGQVVEDHIEELFPSGGAEPVAPVEPPAVAGPEPAHSEAAAGEALDPTDIGAATRVVPLPARPGAAPPPLGWDLLGQCRLDPHRPWSSSYHRLAGSRVSRTDPDAAPMSTGGGAALGYHDHYVVDGGKARIILAALVTPADVQENQALLDLLWRVRFRWRVRPKRAVADAKYGTVANIRAVEEAGIRAYFPLYIGEAGERTRPYYGSSRFRYDAARDVYRCPQDHELRRAKADQTKQMWVYQARAADCRACPVKAACTPGHTGRQVLRTFHMAYLDRVRGYHETVAYQKAMRKRAVWVEPLFGEAKQWHGLRQFRLRRLPKVNMEGLFTAAGQNLKRWLVTTGWGRRHAPCGALAVRQATSVVRRPIGSPPCTPR
jgi:transposase